MPTTPREIRTAPHITIIRDETLTRDLARRYKGLFSASDRYLGTSPDGFNWTMLDGHAYPQATESQLTFERRSWTVYRHGKTAAPSSGPLVFLATSRLRPFHRCTELVFHTGQDRWENRKTRMREIIENPAYITPPTVDDLDYLHTSSRSTVSPAAESYHMAVMPYEGFYGFVLIFNVFELPTLHPT